MQELTFEVDETCKETAGLLKIKEQNYIEMCATVADAAKESAAEKERSAQALKEVKKEAANTRKACELRIKTLKRQFVEELKKFEDRDDLLKQIQQWRDLFNEKRNQLEDQDIVHVEALVRKEECTQVLIDDNTQLREEVIVLRKDCANKVKELEHAASVANVKATTEATELTNKLKKTTTELEEVKSYFDSELTRATTEPPYVKAMRESLADKEKALKYQKMGFDTMAEDYKLLESKFQGKSDELHNEASLFEEKLEKWKSKVEVYERSYTKLKELMVEELQRAEAKCRVMETQLLGMPNPFLEELDEFKQTSSDLTQLIQKSTEENSELLYRMAEMERVFKVEKRELEERVIYVSSILSEVEDLQTIKDISQAG